MMEFENIRLTRYERFPMSFLIAAGPKSIRRGEDGKTEVFDPYVSCEIDAISLSGIEINGTQPDDIAPFIHEIVFDHLYDDAPSTARGTIRRIDYLPPVR